MVELLSNEANWDFILKGFIIAHMHMKMTFVSKKAMINVVNIDI